MEDLRIHETRTTLLFLVVMHCIFLVNVEWFLLNDHIPTYVEDLTSPLNCSARDQFNFLINVHFKLFSQL